VDLLLFATIQSLEGLGSMMKRGRSIFLNRPVQPFDATVALPLLVGAVLQEGKVFKKRKRRRFVWEGEQPKAIRFV
jgi:hypothetical protein